MTLFLQLLNYSRHTSPLANAVDYDELNVLKNKTLTMRQIGRFTRRKLFLIPANEKAVREIRFPSCAVLEVAVVFTKPLNQYLRRCNSPSLSLMMMMMMMMIMVIIIIVIIITSHHTIIIITVNIIIIAVIIIIIVKVIVIIAIIIVIIIIINTRGQMTINFVKLAFLRAKWEIRVLKVYFLPRF